MRGSVCAVVNEVDVWGVVRTYKLVHLCIYIYIYMCVCVFVCMLYMNMPMNACMTVYIGGKNTYLLLVTSLFNLSLLLYHSNRMFSLHFHAHSKCFFAGGGFTPVIRRWIKFDVFFCLKKSVLLPLLIRSLSLFLLLSLSLLPLLS